VRILGDDLAVTGIRALLVSADAMLCCAADDDGNSSDISDDDDDSDSDDDDDDDVGWITPSNIEAMKQASVAVAESGGTDLPVACVTTDYAMQVTGLTLAHVSRRVRRSRKRAQQLGKTFKKLCLLDFEKKPLKNACTVSEATLSLCL